MASRKDGRPEVLGFKIDECPTCHRTGSHVLTETVARAGPFSNTTTHRLVCTSCGAAVPVAKSAAGVAQETGELPIERERPGFVALMTAGSGLAPEGAHLTSPYVSGDTDVFLAQRLAQARAALATGADGMAVQRELFDQFVANPDARSAPAGRTWIPAAIASAAVLAIVAILGTVFFLGGRGEDPSRSAADDQIAVPTPAAEPTPSAVPTLGTAAMPTLVTAAMPTLVTATVPTQTPTPSPVPTLDPGSRLLGLIPSSLRSSCVPRDEPASPASIAAYRCRTTGRPVTVVEFELFGRAGAVSTAFRSSRLDVNITTRGDACFNGSAREYTVYSDSEDRDDRVGEVTCYKRAGKPYVLWSHIDNNMLMWARRNSGSPAGLMDWWADEEAWACDDSGSC